LGAGLHRNARDICPAGGGVGRYAGARARGGLKIHYEELDALREAEDNPNQHSKEQITLMERLLVEYGWITPMGNRRRAGLRPRQVGVSLAAMSPTSPTL
jgi:hypothetical protein